MKKQNVPVWLDIFPEYVFSRRRESILTKNERLTQTTRKLILKVGRLRRRDRRPRVECFKNVYFAYTKHLLESVAAFQNQLTSVV